MSRFDSKKPPVLAIVGPTASGKTGLSVALAKRLGGEIVSCDSMQLYRYMDVGTAKPTEEEKQGSPHHLMDILDPTDPKGYSCADYTRDAKAVVDDILSRGKLPIVCGGTGLYLDAFLRGGSFESTDVDLDLRRELTEYAEVHGAEALHVMLRELDPEAAEATHPNNIKRVVRAIEIYRTTGCTKSELDRRSREVESPYSPLVLGLKYNNREILYDRIGRRVDMMLSDGLVEETKKLREMGVFETCLTAAQAIGYKEFLPYFAGEATLEEAADQIRLSTRRYAKRQLTWFRRYGDALWLHPDTEGAPERPLRTAEALAAEAIAIWKKDGFL